MVKMQLMRENKLAHSFGMRIAFSTEMPLVAKRAGYSAVLMNLEHMAMSIETMKDVAVSCLNVGTAMSLSPTVPVEPIVSESLVRLKLPKTRLSLNGQVSSL